MVVTLKVCSIGKTFRKKPVLIDISFEANASDIIGVIGESGCGKSTLLKILVGYYKPDTGNVFLNNKNVSKDVMNLRKTVGYTSQENAFYEKLLVIENMNYYANLYRIPFADKEKRINDLLEAVALSKQKHVLAENLSGGMKRRLDFAISLIHNPSVLVLDEPTTGLDPLLVSQFWKIVKDVASQNNKIVIVSSHILPEIEKHCTKVVIIKDGIVKAILDRKEIKGLEKKFRRLVMH
ncbi:MAG: ABC transporter ATP-binding protein [Nanoarchaeota archaeon]|nr:ABC transporter ATP-binding protein [Nanoarchaeota archaeon]MBU1322060.1 ABC transporter ATP-binding protein [Nanoarchaeota archaeon]MBU1597252.1 ABC transporter ATP-binding protein [Nanoarchaeota archaeon]MBU2440703.1 ABC transporter ATP-binding protein [Nanoarchaeota archaeon]